MRDRGGGRERERGERQRGREGGRGERDRGREGGRGERDRERERERERDRENGGSYKIKCITNNQEIVCRSVLCGYKLKLPRG